MGWRPRWIADTVGDEAGLIRAARGGDQDAIETIVRRHLAPAWRAAYVVTRRRDLADDAVQDAFERVLRTLDRFDEERPLAPWLHRIVVNCALSALRGEARRAPLHEAAEPVAEGDAELATDVRQVLGAMAALEPDRRAVVALRLLLGYSAAETADMLGVKPGTVHSRLSRGLQQIRTSLGVTDVR